jgi:hypothetical protein
MRQVTKKLSKLSYSTESQSECRELLFPVYLKRNAISYVIKGRGEGGNVWELNSVLKLSNKNAKVVSF